MEMMIFMEVKVMIGLEISVQAIQMKQTISLVKRETICLLLVVVQIFLTVEKE
jgi:hypothetical protein